MEVLDANKRTGNVFNIQKFSIHDGPDIRDTVFMKGCPLHCIWCSNPESQSGLPEISFHSSKCIGVKSCGDCIRHCPQGAICPDENGKVEITRDRCKICEVCQDTCCATAMKVMGKQMTVGEVIAATQNQMSAWRANGGITVSGGEPLMQADFVEELLRQCGAMGIHTAVETCGFAAWADVSRVVKHCDLVFYDVKIWNDEKHQKYTGVSNRMILENLQWLSREYPNLELIVRTPVIPGINDSVEELEKIVDFLKTLNHLTDYELLPYHAFGSNKYAQLGRAYELTGAEALSREKIESWNQQFRKELFGQKRKGGDGLCGKSHP
ncbi:MAG: glycyl-radical enzyme activating protein [Lachnospiraceae bacterium]|jgi:pyruvate formate lyase activating enzyme|nr:glycyl-radical enzyme activating protein [Lachnospiraceae bacterium]